MRTDSELHRGYVSGKNWDSPLRIPCKFSIRDIPETFDHFPESNRELVLLLDSATSVFSYHIHESGLNTFLGAIKKSSEFRQLPETDEIQALEYTTYLSHPATLNLMDREENPETANYLDDEDHSIGYSVRIELWNSYTKIVAYSEGFKVDINQFGYSHVRNNSRGSQLDDVSLQILETNLPKAWQELKQLYREKLQAIPYVQEGYINISAPEYADVILLLSDYSVDRIERLAEIDLELNLKLRPLHFFVEYELSEDNPELEYFERFY